MRASGFIVASSLIFLLLGCENKRLKEPVALAKLPDLAYPVVLPPPEVQPATTASTAPPKPPPLETKDTRVTKNRPRPRTKPPAVSDAADNGQPSNSTQTPPQNVVITPGQPDPGASISAGLPHSDETHHRQTTAELIQMTENNLRSVDHQLSADEQNQVDQIKNFLAQARTATADNDLVRAHNLALKAHLLSDELVRR